MNADSMFEELGYRKAQDDEKRVYYTTQKGIGQGYRGIEFKIKHKKVLPYNRVQIDMRTLKAINKKCEELRLVRRVNIWLMDLWLLGFALLLWLR